MHLSRWRVFPRLYQYSRVRVEFGDVMTIWRCSLWATLMKCRHCKNWRKNQEPPAIRISGCQTIRLIIETSSKGLLDELPKNRQWVPPTRSLGAPTDQQNVCLLYLGVVGGLHKIALDSERRIKKGNHLPGVSAVELGTPPEFERWRKTSTLLGNSDCFLMILRRTLISP